MVQQSSVVSVAGQISQSAALFRKSREPGRFGVEKGRGILPVAHGLHLPLFSLAAETRQSEVSHGRIHAVFQRFSVFLSSGGAGTGTLPEPMHASHMAPFRREPVP